MNILEKIKLIIDKALVFILFIIITLILFCVCWQVFSRYFLKFPATFTEELVRFLLIWLGLLGGTYAFGTKGHISLTLFLDKLKNKVRSAVNIIIDIIVLMLALFILIIGGSNLIAVTSNQLSSVLSIPIWCVYIVTPISGILIIFYQIYYILSELYSIRKTK